MLMVRVRRLLVRFLVGVLMVDLKVQSYLDEKISRAGKVGEERVLNNCGWWSYIELKRCVT